MAVAKAPPVLHVADLLALLQGFFITASQQTTRSSAIRSGVLFVEDHLATIEDLDAVKAYDLPSTVDPGSIIAIHELGNFCSPTLDN